MSREPDPIRLTLDDLRAVGRWALGPVERALPVFEARAPADPRSREAVGGLAAFAAGGKRTARLRSLGWAAWAAADEAGDAAAAAAARAASLAAGIAYTHPLATPHQANHTLGPVAHAALALELAAGGDPGIGDAEVRRSIGSAPLEVRSVVSRMARPARGRGRLVELIHQLDGGLRDPAPAAQPAVTPSRLMRFPGAVERDPAVEAWMRDHAGPLGTVARRWFDVMRSCGDDVRELLHDGHPTACVGDAAFGYVNAFTAHVNVGFFCGAELADPSGLLEGTGRFMRHVKLRPERPVDGAALTSLIETAYADIKERLGLSG